MEGVFILSENGGRSIFLTQIWTKSASTVMSLLAGYSSDEDGGADVTKDVFSLGSLPAAKKPRVEQPSTLALIAAPHVLSEVCFMRLFLATNSDKLSLRTH